MLRQGEIAPMSEDFLDKAAFCKRHGITPRTVDAWVKKGRVERIQGVDLKAYFRLLPEGSPAALPQPPQWAIDLMEQQSRIEAKLDALLAAPPPVAPPLLSSPPDAPSPESAAATEQPGSPPVAHRSWWRRLFYGPG
jgi:hypothetical protein